MTDCSTFGTPVPESEGGWSFCSQLSNGLWWSERIIYTGEQDANGNCTMASEILPLSNDCSGTYGSPGHGLSSYAKRWWHITLQIINRTTMQVLDTITSVGQPASVNEDPSTIFAKNIDCGPIIVIPVAAFDADESPGWFYFYPSNAKISNSIISVNSYDDVVNFNNRHIFRYVLTAAYDKDDTTCSGITPDTHDTNPWDVIIDDYHGICFQLPTIPLIETFGCCEIAADLPGTPLESLDVHPTCSRVWVIEEPSSTNNIVTRLWSLDVTGTSSVDRGVIGNSYNIFFDDIAWDNRGYLWGLSTSGLRRIIPGNSTVEAITCNASNITKNVPSFPSIFPYNQISQGGGGLSFDSVTGNMYAFTIYLDSSGLFKYGVFELQSRGDNAWEIMKYFISPANNSYIIGDVAFSGDGTAYGIYVNNAFGSTSTYLCKINTTSNIGQGFGSIELIGSDNSDLLSITGLTFLGNDGIPDNNNQTLYALNDAGQLFTTDITNGNLTLVSGVQIGTTTLGMTNCQSGEDLRILPVPFYPGQSPWLFVIDISSSMANNNHLDRIKTGLKNLFSDYARFGDSVYFCLFNNQDVPISYSRQLRTSTDVVAINAFIDNNLIASGPASNLCGALNYIKTTGNYPHTLKSIVIISDGNFSDCSNSSQVSSLLSDISIEKNEATFYAVGTDPVNPTILTTIGNFNNGGYTNWR